MQKFTPIMSKSTYTTFKSDCTTEFCFKKPFQQYDMTICTLSPFLTIFSCSPTFLVSKIGSFVSQLQKRLPRYSCWREEWVDPIWHVHIGNWAQNIAKLTFKREKNLRIYRTVSHNTGIKVLRNPYLSL